MNRCRTKYLSVLLPVVLLTGLTVRAAAELPHRVRDLITAQCLDCHDADSAKGELNLEVLSFEPDLNGNRERWVRVYDRVLQGEMPPPKKARGFGAPQRNEFTTLLGAELLRADRADVAANGRGPLRRLTREEFEYNLRDLLRLPHLDVADMLPEDREARGFTRVARLLDMSRVQLAAYLDATEAALREAVATGVKPPAMERRRFTGTDLFPSLTSFGGTEAMFFAKHGRLYPLTNVKFQKMTADERRDSELELALFRSATWPYFGYPRGFRARLGGAYRVRFAGRAVRQLPGFRLVPAYDPQPMSFRARQPSGADVSGDVRETGGWLDLQPETKEFETTIRLKAGETFEYSLLGLPVPFIRTDGGFFYDYPPMPPEGHRGAAFQWLEVEGPLPPAEWPPASHRVLFGDLPIRPAAKGSRLGVEVISTQPKVDAGRLFQRFAERAARRPVAPEDRRVFLDLIMAKLDDGAPFAEALLTGCQAFLCSGHFLYLTEPKAGDASALAARLSHFLWSSRPDEPLLAKAVAGGFDLQPEVDRMIADARFERFVASFTGQWLDLRRLRRDIPDVRLYPEYRKDDYLVDSMERETHAFFAAMVRDNLPVTTLVDADFSCINDRLAAHYGLPRQRGSEMRRVTLPEWSPYGGLLTQAAVLKLTANGTTTSPVLRGVWVMEKLIGEPPPAPPKSVPAIKPDIRGAATIRELLAKHTDSQSCAACHARFDPVGFALESFDVMGAWRDRYRGLEKGDKITGFDPAGHPFIYYIGPEVDPSGRLRSGEAFADIHELKQLLATRPRQLARNLLQQFTLYATGTPIRFSDRPVIDSILDRTESNGFGVRDLLEGLIQSPIFTGTEATPPQREKASAHGEFEPR